MTKLKYLKYCNNLNNFLKMFQLHHVSPVTLLNISHNLHKEGKNFFYVHNIKLYLI